MSNHELIKHDIGVCAELSDNASPPIRGVFSHPNEWSQGDTSPEYAEVTLDYLETFGVERSLSLAEAGIDPSQLKSNISLTTLQDASLLAYAMHVTKRQGLGFDLGLRCHLTAHGVLAMGMMSCPTLRDALQLWVDYLDLRIAGFRVDMHEHDGEAELIIHDMVPSAPMRTCALERFVAMTTLLVHQLVKQPIDDMEIWFNDEKKPHINDYLDLLPKMRFGTGQNLIRISSSCLDIALQTSHSLTLSLTIRQCENDRRAKVDNRYIVYRIRSMILSGDPQFYGIEKISNALCMSSRTVKRRLRDLGTNFRKILDDVRKEKVLRDLMKNDKTIDEIAFIHGYAAPSNLTRAFRRWTGYSPTRYRERIVGD